MAKFHNNKLRMIGLDDGFDQDHLTEENWAAEKAVISNPKSQIPANSSATRSSLGDQMSPVNQTSDQALSGPLHFLDNYPPFNENDFAPVNFNEYFQYDQVPQLGGNNYDLRGYSDLFWMEPSANAVNHGFLGNLDNVPYCGPEPFDIDHPPVEHGALGNLSLHGISQMGTNTLNSGDIQNQAGSIIVNDDDVDDDYNDENKVINEADSDAIPEVSDPSDSEYDDHEVKKEPTTKLPKVNKSGIPRKSRQPRPKLLKWSDNDWKVALLSVIWSCGEAGLAIPFAIAAQLVGKNCTAGALQQAILKLRTKMIEAGYSIPPLKMNWTRKNEKTAAQSNPQNAPASISARAVRKKPVLQNGAQTRIITLKCAYSEASRVHLETPYTFRRALRKQQRVQTRKAMISKRKDSTQELSSVHQDDQSSGLKAGETGSSADSRVQSSSAPTYFPGNKPLAWPGNLQAVEYSFQEPGYMPTQGNGGQFGTPHMTGNLNVGNIFTPLPSREISPFLKLESPDVYLFSGDLEHSVKQDDNQKFIETSPRESRVYSPNQLRN